MSGNELVGTGTLVRLAVRRDRLMPLWVLVLGVLPAARPVGPGGRAPLRTANLQR